MTDVHPNIFKPKNDWNVKAFRCRKSIAIDSFEKRVARIVKESFGVDVYEDTNHRDRELVDARRIFMSLMVKHTKRTQASIGRILGKDHATVIHAVRTTENLCQTDVRFKEVYDLIDNRIKQLN